MFKKSCLNAGNTIVRNTGEQVQFNLMDIEVSVR